MKGLDKQVYIYSLGTECFYTDEEYIIHNKLMRLYLLKKKSKSNTIRVKKKFDLIEKEIKKLIESKTDNERLEQLTDYRDKLINWKRQNRSRIKYINDKIQNEKKELSSLFEKFKGTRILRNETLTKNKVIGMFDSNLSRTIGMKTNVISESLFVVRAFYFNILEDIINNGFIHNDEKYIYFSSSAGQIRTKKTVFIKESLWNEHEKTLTCGLTLKDINDKGGCNVNKYLAYKALTSSASAKWNGFDINKAIVVPDLCSPVTALFDCIDRDTYEIVRKEKTVDIEHTDGCGMILPSESKKSFMCRAPFIKGLLVPFNFKEFAIESGNTKISDIYGKEWDIVDDDISIILTKSQFKMAKYYENWEDYKEKFIKYNCQASKLNIEDVSGYAKLNYQMIQTLTDITDDELSILCDSTNEDIKKIHHDKATILKILGATKNNNNKNHFQQGLFIYPELINDNHSRRIIKNKKESMINDARSGKLNINGKYLYLVPDLYAFCEFLFKNIKKPKGLLHNGEVYTSVFNEGKVDILRSPHLYKEHAIRKVNKSDEMKRWFITQGIYTSVHDAISRILQFDNDGDKSLVVQDETLIKVAERNMKDVYPLYYEMGVAEAVTITNKQIFESLIKAFKANIGEVSNNITKIFNSGNEIDLDVVKWLTAENNYIIDFAKTLYMPTRPPEVDERIRDAIKGKVPHFFMEAKQKNKKNVEPINNSTMNRIRKLVYNKKIEFENIGGTLDYKMLMSSDVQRLNRKVTDTFKSLNKEKYKIIKGNSELSSKKEGLDYVYKYIRDSISIIESNVDIVVNNLIKDIYDNRNSAYKDTLWNCYGDVIINNLRENLKGTKQCECCGVRIKTVNNQTKYCNNCFEIERKKYIAMKVREHRLKNKNVNN